MNLTTCTGVEALRWVDKSPVDLDDALTLIGKGVVDTDEIEKMAKHVWEIDDLPDGVPLTSETLRLVSLVGKDVYAADPENVEEWAALAERCSEYLHDPADVFRAFVEAGRGPTYARQIIDVVLKRYEENKAVVDPAEYGFADEITPAVFADLADADIANGTLDDYRALGLSIEQAIAAKHDGLWPQHVQRAQATGLARDDWKATYSGIPTEWLALLDEGWAIDDLRYLVDKGWAAAKGQGPARRKVGYDYLRHSGRVSTNPRWLATSPANARELADLGFGGDEEMKRYREALMGGQRTFGYLDRGAKTEQVADAVLALARIGVKASHIAAFRLAGARSLDDIKRLVAAGIDHERADYLRKTYAPTLNRWSSRQEFRDIDEVLKAQERDAREAEARAAVTV